MYHIPIVADAHFNSTVALCAPKTELEHGFYKMDDSQKWLWDNWLEFISRVPDNSDMVLFNGDMADGDEKKHAYEIITENPAFIVRNASAGLEPLTNKCKELWFVKGTPAHVGKSGNLEELLAYDLGGMKIGNNHAHYELKLNIGGVRIDISHPRPVSLVPHLRGMTATRYAFRIWTEYNLRREKPPDLVIRSHGHLKGDSHDEYPTRCIFTPCWSNTTEYGYRVAHGALPDIGAIILHIDSGHYEIEPFNVPKPRVVWQKISPKSK